MKSNIKVLKSALPLYLEGTNGRAVLVQHGYNGYPAEVYKVARRLHAEGYTVAVPRLPGHATNRKDFQNSNWKLWLDHLRNEYLNLQSRFESVTIVGLSMGSLLAILAAAEFQPEKIILLAPAIAVKQKLVYFTPVLRFLIPYIKRDRPRAEVIDEDRIFMEREYWSRHYTAQLAGFIKIMRMARRKLKDINCPVYIMLSEKDSTVPLSAGEIIEAGVKDYLAEKLILKNSPHVFFEGPECDPVTEKVVDWVNG